MTERKVDSCSFLPCDQADVCCLEGGCVPRRFPVSVKDAGDRAKKGQRALNGQKPSRFTKPRP